MTGNALPRRYLGLWLPFLPADRWRRDCQHDETRPLVFAAKAKGISHIEAVDAHARSCGLRPGMALADARVRVPQLRALSDDPIADAAFLDHIAGLARAFTPSIALDLPNGLALDITGCAHLFEGEAGLVARLQSVLRAAGLSAVKIAVATTPDMARALARFARKHPCIADNDKSARALPVEALEWTAEDTTALKRAGLKTIADVANRPSILFTSRFSSAFSAKLARVLGEEDRRIASMREPSPYRAERRFPEPVASHDVIEAIVAELAAAVCQQLHGREVGGRSFESTFVRADGAVRRIRVDTSQPARDPRMILRLYRDRLDALADPLDPGFGFDLIAVEALRAEPWTESQTSLDANEDQNEKLAHFVDRLTAMFGRERILQLQANDSHIPERAQAVIPASAKKTSKQSQSTAQCRPPLLYRRPHPIDVQTGEHDCPAGFKWRRMTHRIAHAEGPERIEDEWWRANSEAGARDYFSVESFEGRRFWIFRAHTESHGATPRWFLHGLYP